LIILQHFFFPSCSSYLHFEINTSDIPQTIKQTFMYFKNKHLCWVPVAHACNPSYSEDKDQEGCGSKPAPISKKNPTQNRAGGVT
jgi:hypothetical protein